MARLCWSLRKRKQLSEFFSVKTSEYFLFFGLIIGLYQGYRGFMFQWIRKDEPFVKWGATRKVLLLAFSDGFFYFVTTTSGFVSLVLCQHLFEKIPDISRIAVGTASLLVFLAIYGVLGATGQLPSLIQSGKLLPSSGM